MQLCLKLYPMEYPGAANDKYEHWFITNGDGSWVLEFGEFSRGPTDMIVGVHSNPRGEYDIKDTFILTQEVMERMKKVVGATNYSVALRNCEHVARYIQSGSWVSFQMSGKGVLRKMFYKDMAAYTKMVNKLPLELKEAGEEVKVVYEENESSGRTIFQVKNVHILAGADLHDVAGDAEDSADPGGCKRLQHPLPWTHWLRQVFLGHLHQHFDHDSNQESRP